MKEPHTDQNHDHVFQGEEAPRPTLPLRELEPEPDPRFVAQVQLALYKHYSSCDFKAGKQTEPEELDARVNRQLHFLFPALPEFWQEQATEEIVAGRAQEIARQAPGKGFKQEET